jgi:hypothetical protein
VTGDLQHIIFCHIPKCGGSHVNAAMAALYADAPAKYDKPQMSKVDHRLMVQFGRSLARKENKGVYFGGHRRFEEILEQGLYRKGDVVFSSYRNPLDIAVSYINYIFTRIEAEPDSERPDIQGWLRKMKLDVGRVQHDPAYALEVFARNKDFQSMTHNIICRFLGNGTFASARANVEKYGIEMIPLKKLDDWLLEKWGVPKGDHANTSKKFLTNSQLPESVVKDYHKSIIKEDFQMFDWLNERYAAAS